ncbi:Phospholipid scramblase 2 [Orchesella cincta]|uniref:Phospholipid scramblase n=1 Tax=Orchesella cincta TaxID=48709 RepID=A0A1D2MLR5_ORCCI|nr:Phospholipid scramblase 2 [Orchesella cincta]
MTTTQLTSLFRTTGGNDASEDPRERKKTPSKWKRGATIRQLAMSMSRKGSSSRKQAQRLVAYLPAPFPSCPPGMERLVDTTHLFVRQGVRQTQPPFAIVNKQDFEVLNAQAQRIFIANDLTDDILKLCCRGGCGQPFKMSIKEKHSGYEILCVSAHPDCYGAMTGTISQNGVNIGFITEDLRLCASQYIITDAQGREVFRIFGVHRINEILEGQKKGKKKTKQTIILSDHTSATLKLSDIDEMLRTNFGRSDSVDPTDKFLNACFKCCGAGDFVVYYSVRGELIGRMGKQWDELAESYYAVNDCFGVNFPKELSVRHKALLLATLFLLDFNHFQL